MVYFFALSFFFFFGWMLRTTSDDWKLAAPAQPHLEKKQRIASARCQVDTFLSLEFTQIKQTNR